MRSNESMRLTALVSMVQVGVVWVLVAYWPLPVPTRARFGHWAAVVVVLVMDVTVLVHHRLMRVLVLLGETEP